MNEESPPPKGWSEKEWRREREEMRRIERKRRRHDMLVSILVYSAFFSFWTIESYWILAHGINLPPVIGGPPLSIPPLSLPPEITNELIALTIFALGGWFVTNIILRYLFGIGSDKELLSKLDVLAEQITWAIQTKEPAIDYDTLAKIVALAVHKAFEEEHNRANESKSSPDTR